jgi:tRNA1(Val) A37 N6-methylase TrmN6
MTQTCDAFLGGKIQILQPKSGFRAGSDSVLLGASVASSATSVLDLGAGVGTAALCAMARLPALTGCLAEQAEAYCTLASQNIAENGMADRATSTLIDVTASGKQRLAAGLLSDHFASVIANPPYFDSEKGTAAPEADRAAARAMQANDLDNWVRTAAACVMPKGEVIFIYRASGIAQLLSAFARFGDITILPICAREGEDAGRILVRGIKGARGPTRIKAPLVTHTTSGHEYSEKMQAILRDGAALDW